MKSAIAGILVLAVLVVGVASFYTVDEAEQVVITQFGKAVRTNTTPGPAFKLPFIQKVNRFDRRWLEWDGDADEMPTKEKTYIWVDTYARWRIADPLKFLESVVDERGAQSRLDDIIDGETRNVIAAHRLIEVVRSTNREMSFSVEDGLNFGSIPSPVQDRKEQEQIAVGRKELARMVLEKAATATPEYGIELVDVQFSRVNYTESVEQKNFERMISERKIIAAAHRSEGEKEASRIRGSIERLVQEIESAAYREVQNIKGKADARAADIYARAYNLDPDFYKLLRSLESYKKTIDAQSTVILSTDSDYFKALVDMNAR